MEPLVVGIGELLWDLFPRGRRLGGAPGNVAFHACRLGCRGAVVSRVGDDPLGREVLERLDAQGVDRQGVQVDPQLPTSTVQVALDPSGHPSYTIHENVAWDALAFSDPVPALIRGAEVVCFGTLASRNPVSRETVRRALRAAEGKALRLFDVNLRLDHHSPALIREYLAQCEVLKLNEDELAPVAAACGLPPDPEALRARWGLRVLALTLGGRGSALFTADGRLDAPGRPVIVRDTVGAGDAFTAALAAGLAKGDALDLTLRRAAALSAFVCSQDGSTPDTAGFLREDPAFLGFSGPWR